MRARDKRHQILVVHGRVQKISGRKAGAKLSKPLRNWSGVVGGHSLDLRVGAVVICILIA